MKNPDEIKKGLECCTSRDCGGNKCPYFNEKSCIAAKSADALALIQQYEKTIDNLAEANAAVHKKCDSLRLRVENREESLRHLNNLRDAAAGRAWEMEERVHQLEAERDAAVADILYAASVYLGECNTCKNGEVCAACKRQDACDECPNSKCMCSGCGTGRSNWQWRGVQQEE